MLQKKLVLALTAFLLLGMVAVGGALAGCKSTSSDNGGDQTSTSVFEDISALEAYELIQNQMMNPNFIIIDVRTADEYNAERLADAINIDFYAANFADQLDMLDKSKVYLLYCRSANRSHQALETMEDLGFTEAYNMIGGINAWKDAGYPTNK